MQDSDSSLIFAYAAIQDKPWHRLESCILTLSSAADHIPDELTYKQSYPVEGKSQEGPLFAQLNSQFGITNVIGYHVYGTGDPHGSTKQLLNGAEYWTFFEQHGLSKNRCHEPEKRGLQCIALSGEDKALVNLHNTDRDMPSLGKLLESILHAIIGRYCSIHASLLLMLTNLLRHYNLFQKGILHCDVSSGNVLWYSEPVWCPTLDELSPSFSTLSV